MVGWREFASNRTAMLAKYDSAKALSVSRPVKTEHGVTGEAAIREWLGEFLPMKYRVTSGFIIPDIVAAPVYKLYHYDVIIFDALNAPVLWTDPNPDQAAQGKRRAIPARFVHSVMEVKASYGAKSAEHALRKLRELNAIASHFPPHFSSCVVFMELPVALASQGGLLCHLLPEPPIHAFRGGIILRCEINSEMSGNITIHKSDGNPASVQNFSALPLAKDIDTLNIYINKEGGCVIAESAGAATFVADGVSNWMVSKMYAPTFCGKNVCVTLGWSANGFARFALDTLYYLEGADPQNYKYQFGQVFDHLERRE
jgi:hypothetical protein